MSNSNAQNQTHNNPTRRVRDTDASKNVYSIYTLSDPTMPEKIFYVGITINLKQRFRAHCSPARQPSSEMGRWIMAICARGRKPAMRNLITFEATRREAYKIEWQFITKFAEQDHPLTNSLYHPARKLWELPRIWDSAAWRAFYE